jgi:subtilisin family serine protease
VKRSVKGAMIGVVAAVGLFAPMLLPASVAGAQPRPSLHDVTRAQALAQSPATAEELILLRGLGRPSAFERKATPGGLPLRSGDTADYLTARNSCFVDAHYDDLDGTALDVADYGMLYECEFVSEWAFLIRTADSWLDSQLEYGALQLDADGLASTGCGGFEFLVYAFESTSGLLAGLFQTPTCDTSQAAYLSDLEVARGTNDGLAVFFDNRLIGDPDDFFWVADVMATSDAASDLLPNSGFHPASGFKSTADACTPATQGYILSSDDPRATEVLSVAGASSVRRSNRHAVTFSGPVGPALRALRKAGIEGRVEPNVILERYASPNDLTSAQWAPAHVSASGAWEVTRGSAQLPVGVIDSGIDATHPDLVGKVQPGFDAYSGQTLASGNTDEIGHGTSVASVIGAATDNSAGVAGLGWNTPVVAIRVDDPEGAPDTAALASGLRWAADHGLRVVNVSIGSCAYTQAVADAVAYAVNRGTVVVASAGNSALEGNATNYPAALDGVVAVGATGFSGTHAPYSNTGSYVDLVAPGGSAADDGDLSHGMLVLAPGAQVTRVDGTSFSAPMVAAGAALVLSVNPQLTNTQVAQVLTSTATDLGVAGRDDTYGAGMLNLDRAVRSAAAMATPSSSPSPSSAPSPAQSTSPSPAASAEPSNDPTPVDFPPSVTVMQSSIAAGEQVTVTYRGNPDTIIGIYSRTQPATEFSYIRSVLLDSNGFGSSTHKPQKNTRITARSAAGSFSANAPIIAVRSVASLTVSRVGTRTYTFTGRVYPARLDRMVFLYRNGSYAGVARTDSRGIYRLTRSGLGAGTFTFQMRTGDDTHNLGTRSPERRVLVY